MKASYIPIEKVIVREGFNPRENFGDMGQLKNQLRATGMTDPVRVRHNSDGTVTLGAQGHRRLQALKELKEAGYGTADNGLPLDLLTLPEEESLNDNDRTLSIITLNSGKPLEYLEAATVYGRLIGEARGKERDNLVEVIASKVGCSKQHIRDSLMLLTAPEAVLDLIKQWKVAASLVITTYQEKRDWEKVLTILLAAIADAEAKGKTKASKKNVKEGDKEGEESEDDEEGEDEKKVELKRAGAIVKRLEKMLSTLLGEQEGLERGSLLYETYESVIVALVHLGGDEHPAQEGFEPSLGDVKAQINGVVKKSANEIKAINDENKTILKQQAIDLKVEFDAKLESLKAKHQTALDKAKGK